MTQWLHGCMVAWLHGCMVAWLDDLFFDYQLFTRSTTYCSCLILAQKQTA
jgi:hypothetical protein